jgi:hypothetical protein
VRALFAAEGMKAMYRLTFLPVFLVGIAHTALAQTLQPTAADPRVHSAKDAQIILQVRRVVLRDKDIKFLTERFRLKLPEISSCTVLSNKPAELLAMAAAGDRRYLADAMRPITLANGETGNFPLYGPKYADTVEAKISSKGQAVDLRFVWAKWEDGKQRLPVMTAAVPTGSHVLIHDAALICQKRTDSYWDWLADKLSPNRKHEIDCEQGYWLVSPRVAVQKEVANRPAAAGADPQRHRFSNVRIDLEMQWLWLNDSFVERCGVAVPIKMPATGSYAVCGRHPTELLVQYVDGDPQSSIYHIPTVMLPSGEKREVSLWGRRDEVEGRDTLRGTVSGDRQVVQVQLAWCRSKDGKERSPVVNAAIPVGSHLLIHTHDLVLYHAPKTPTALTVCWDQLVNWYLDQPRHHATLWKETRHAILQVTPRVVLPEGRQNQVAAR